MILCIENVLTPEELRFIHQALKEVDFVDGQLTAGQYAKEVKHNQQMAGGTDVAQQIRAQVQQALQRNLLFQMAVRPRRIRPALISRYELGMSYGTHTDNALMGDTDITRSDVSITLFLSDPDSYQGGELMLDTGLGEQAVKCPAGAAFIYPSTFLHRVAAVTQGVRLVAVTWAQSVVRDSQERELLFELDTVRRSIFENYGKTVEFDLLSKTHANLLRKWAIV